MKLIRASKLGTPRKLWIVKTTIRLLDLIIRVFIQGSKLGTPRKLWIVKKTIRL